MMTRRMFATLPLMLAMSGGLCAAATPVRAMLLDGESGGPYHDWRKTTPLLKRILEDSGRFTVDVVTAPPKGGDFSNFKPEWSKYQVVVWNYDAPDERWTDDLRSSFEQYVKNGGGMVLVHAADNAFPKWEAFNEMAGIGGWRGRNENSGPYWYFQDGKLVSDPSPGPAGNHGARTPYKVETRAKNHPIMKGLPAAWLHVGDELYSKMRGPGKNMTVLATAYSEPSNKGTGHDEPILMVLSYGKGRIFHTLMGHDVVALNCVGFITTLQRGTEWAATGKVTQKVPADFPAADKTSTRPQYQ